MENLPVYSVNFVFRERYDRYNDPKNTKATISCLTYGGVGAGCPFVCTYIHTCGSNTRLKFQIKARKIERGIAVLPLVLITTCLMYRNRFLVISLDG